MSTTTTKKELIDWIKKLDDGAILATLQSLKSKSSKSDFWSNLPEEAKQDIQRAKKQLKEGEGISHKQVMQEVRERFLS